MHLNLQQATQLTAMVVMAMVSISDRRQAICMLVRIGMLSGSFVISMNAMLQYRSHFMIGSVRSIALQNSNEIGSILIILGAYAVMILCGINIITIDIFYELFTALTMALLYHWQGRDQD